MEFKDIKRILEAELEREGITEYEIYSSGSEEISCETLDGQISTTASSNRLGLCLRVIADGKMGYASGELLCEEELSRLVRVARDNALSTDKVDTVGIFGGSDSYSTPNYKDVKEYGIGELKEMALSLSSKLFAEGEDVKKGTSSATFYSKFTVNIANSGGLNLENKCAVCGAMTEAIVERDGESQSAYAVRDIDESSDMAGECVSEAREKIGAVPTNTGKYNLVLDGKVMRSLLSAFSPAFSGKRALDGLSKLVGKEGCAVASEIVTLTDDPMLKGASVGTPFDAEGVATSRKAIIENGILKTLLHNRESALRMGKETTANASKASYASAVGISPFCFSIEAGDATLDELFSFAKDGIYVTEIKGLHAGTNAVTGDFSLESAGFMIRDGRKCEAVKSFTVSDNFFDFLKKIERLSDKVEIGLSGGFTNFGSPAVFVRDMSVAGK